MDLQRNTKMTQILQRDAESRMKTSYNAMSLGSRDTLPASSQKQLKASVILSDFFTNKACGAPGTRRSRRRLLISGWWNMTPILTGSQD
jgi:hypothetical protein